MAKIAITVFQSNKNFTPLGSKIQMAVFKKSFPQFSQICSGKNLRMISKGVFSKIVESLEVNIYEGLRVIDDF
jgi:hypothetical protein